MKATLKTTIVSLFFATSIIVNLTACSADKNTDTSTNVEIKPESPLVGQAKELQVGNDKVLINIDQSLKLLKQAADQGDAKAQNEIAKYYSVMSDYRYLPENNALYKKMRIEAAKQGNYDAYLSLQSDEIMDGEWGSRSFIKEQMQEIDKSVQKLAEKGSIEAMRTMVLVLDDESGRLNDEQCQWLYKAVQKGDLWEAGYTIQNCDDEILKQLGAKTQSEYQQDFAKERQKRFELLQKKSKSGDILAKQELVEGFSSESNMTKKELTQLNKEIEEHYADQARRGSSDVYLLLALKKENEDEKKALYMKAAELNNHVALTLLAEFYLFPDDENKIDKKKGLAFLEKAVAQNDPQAINYLGLWYYNDEDKSDEELAIKYFKRAAELGSVDAMTNLARVAVEPENYHGAVQAYENGSIEDDIQDLALIAYQNGYGTKKDSAKVKKLQEIIQFREQFKSTMQEATNELEEEKDIN